MRYASVVCVAACLLASACNLPRPWQSQDYEQACVEQTEAPNSDQLFVTYRMPRCSGGRVELTHFRASRPYYASQDGSGRDARLSLHRELDWKQELERRVRSTGKAPVLFIHGHNNSNAAALKRARRIEWALKERYPVVALTWPSYASKKSYFWDEANAEWTADQAPATLSKLVQAFPGTVVVAHSMGNRIALPFVAEMNSKQEARNIARLIMAAPDVDRDVAAARFRAGLGVDVTLYASLRDQPLSASWRGHGYSRAGDFSWWVSGRKPYYAFAWIPRVEVVDTTRIDSSLSGHSAFIDTPEGAADLCRVINGPDPNRPGVYRDPAKPTNYAHLIGSNAEDQCSWTLMPRSI